MNKRGFTLAEVLITLGIIGVVAAMTLPTLIQNHKKQVYAVGAKKGYNIIYNMINKMQADEEASSYATTSLFSNGVCSVVGTWDESGNFTNQNGCEEQYGNPSVIEQIIPKYLKVVKICKGNDCNIKYNKITYIEDKKLKNEDNEKSILAAGPYSEWSTIHGFYTPDGMIIYVYPNENELSFAFDINGEKGPNIKGRDLFYTQFCLNGRIKPTYFVAECYDANNSNSWPLAYLMSNGWKMDY